MNKEQEFLDVVKRRLTKHSEFGLININHALEIFQSEFNNYKKKISEKKEVPSEVCSVCHKKFSLRYLYEIKDKELGIYKVMCIDCFTKFEPKIGEN